MGVQEGLDGGDRGTGRGGGGAVHGAGNTGRAFSEVNRHRGLRRMADDDVHPERHPTGLNAIGIQVQLIAVRPLGQPSDGVPQPPLGAITGYAVGLDDPIEPERPHDLAEPLLRRPKGTHDGHEVAAPLLGNPHVGEEHVHEGLVRSAPVIDLDGGDQESLLVDLPGIRRDAARRHATHVRVVNPDDDPEGEAIFNEERIEVGYVVHVGPKTVRIVEDEDVSGRDGDGIVLRKSDQLSVRGQEPA